MTPEQAHSVIFSGIEKAKNIAEEDIALAIIFLYELYTDEVLDALQEDWHEFYEDDWESLDHEEYDEYFEDFYP